MYNQFLEYILPTLGTCLGVIITALGAYVVTYINKKKEEISQNMTNEKGKKYLDMVSETIIKCVIATNQTYVDALKKENAFTAEAQKEAFNRTFNNVMNILSEDCLLYLETITNDVEEYIKNEIEAEVNLNKNSMI